jgi:hypothetical protein
MIGRSLSALAGGPACGLRRWAQFSRLNRIFHREPLLSAGQRRELVAADANNGRRHVSSLPDARQVSTKEPVSRSRFPNGLRRR